MKLLLTSAGIRNASIHNALLDLLGKPIADSNALYIPTAICAIRSGPVNAWRFISGREPNCPMCELGWKSLGVLDLTALPSLGKERWVPMLQEIDVLLVNGGDPLYLCCWMRQSGAGRFCDVSASGSRDAAAEYHGPRNKMGCRDRGAGIRDGR